MEDSFRELYSNKYGYAPDDPTELVNLEGECSRQPALGGVARAGKSGCESGTCHQGHSACFLQRRLSGNDDLRRL